ncbi:MAG: hypothetical protein L0Y42_05940, partial [Phycisphaerales bacterium]|nr:hypothetical protein [Phycisphaerales bacterium]
MSLLKRLSALVGMMHDTFPSLLPEAGRAHLLHCDLVPAGLGTHFIHQVTIGFGLAAVQNSRHVLAVRDHRY